MTCSEIHRRLAELEADLAQADRTDAFSRYVADLAPVERRVIQDYFARIRDTMRDSLRANEIPMEVRPVSLRWALTTGLVYVQVVLAGMGPEHLRGYGPVSVEGRTAALRLQQELRRLVEDVLQYLRQETGADLAHRLTRLEQSVPNLSKTLQALDSVVTRRGLVEFRPQIELILQRLENSCLEIAVFGRVSSGKSSLLNHVAGQDVLPVGVTPITAVPTRLAWGEREEAVIDFAEAGRQSIDVSQLAEYASEEKNPGNVRHVTRIEVRLPSTRLNAGIVLVDTPGIGSLARAGSRETFAYLPRCDIAVVLIDAAATINDEDIDVLRRLLEAGVPVQLLLSKADLLNAADRERMLAYIREQVERHLSLSLPVFPVSVVGADETLLSRWFDEQIAPLRHQHQELVRASLRRKLAQLRDSVIGTLESLGRRSAGDVSTEAVVRMRQLLEAADDSLREFESAALDWGSAARQLPVEAILRRAAESIVRTTEPIADDATLLRRVVEEALQERGEVAVQVGRDLQGELTRTLQGLAEAGPLMHLDVAAVQQLSPAGLPVAEWIVPRDRRTRWRPWWSSGAAWLARHTTYRRLMNDVGPDVRDALARYDRQVGIWLRDYFARLKTAYEAQVAAVREQLRRERISDGENGCESVDPAELERDIQQLRQLQSDTNSDSESVAEQAFASDATDEPKHSRSSRQSPRTVESLV